MKCTQGSSVPRLLLSSGLLLVLACLCLWLLTPRTGLRLVRREQGRLWAVLVAGSRGWENYRHQADVCHAYQVLHSHGVPEDNIIVMMYDDIAYNQRNPYQGRIFNRPNGSDVYKGVPRGNLTYKILCLCINLLQSRRLYRRKREPQHFSVNSSGDRVWQSN